MNNGAQGGPLVGPHGGVMVATPIDIIEPYLDLELGHRAIQALDRVSVGTERTDDEAAWGAHTARKTDV